MAGSNTAAAKKTEPQSVRYKGNAEVARITKADWKKAGVEHDDVEFNADNEYTLSVEKLSDEARKVLEKDPRFTFSKVEAPEGDGS